MDNNKPALRVVRTPAKRKNGAPAKRKASGLQEESEDAIGNQHVQQTSQVRRSARKTAMALVKSVHH